MVDMIDPKLGERILDPACGTGGFLTCALEHIKNKYVKTSDDSEKLHKLIKDNDVLKVELNKTLNKEKHVQQVALLKEQNRVAEEKFSYLKEMERNLKQIALDYKKSDKKE